MQKLLTSLIILLFGGYSFAQVYVDLEPSSNLFPSHKQFIPQQNTTILDSLDIESLMDDEMNQNYFATAVPFLFNLKKEGHTIINHNGRNIWRYQITIPNALSLGICYQNFNISKQGTLHVYDKNRTNTLGAYTAQNNNESKEFFTGMIDGNTIIIEYSEPFQSLNKGNIEIFRLYASFRNRGIDASYFGQLAGENPGSSLDCTINVNCVDDPTTQKLKKSSVRYTLATNNGLSLCSGNMVNNHNQDEKPYMLTAYHCIQNKNINYNLSKFYFHYEAPNCENKNQAPIERSVLGAKVLSFYNNSDNLLLELNQKVPREYCILYAGWDATGSIPNNAQLVHHPNGDLSKYSYISNLGLNFNFLNWSNNVSNPPGYHMTGRVGRGVIQKGSSGSCLFNISGKVVATIHGGGVNGCQTNTVMHFGRLSRFWDGGGNRSNRIKDYLDPNNTNQKTLDGYEPCSQDITVKGILFLDENKNNLSDNGELFIVSADVILHNLSSGEKLTTKSDNSGKYSFEVNRNENFQIEVQINESLGLAPIQKGNQVLSSHLNANYLSDNLNFSNQAATEVQINGGFTDILKPQLVNIPIGKELSCGEKHPDFSVSVLDNTSNQLVAVLDSVVYKTNEQTDSIKYTWTATDNFGNISKDSTTYIYSSPIKIKIIKEGFSICQAFSTQLDVDIDADETNLRYEWNATNAILNEIDIKNPLFAVSQAGEYLVTLTVTTPQGCSSSAETTIKVSGSEINGNINAPSTSCLGDKITLIAPNANEYTWTTPSGQTHTNRTLEIESFDNDHVGEYTLIAKGISCSSNFTHKLSIQPDENWNIISPQSICQGDSIKLECNDLLKNTIWKLGSQTKTSNTATFSSENLSGEVTIQVQANNSFSCNQDTTIKIEIANTNSIQPPNDTSICEGEPFKLEINPSGYKILKNDLEIESIDLPYASITHEGWYYFIPTNLCSKKDSFYLKVNNLPEAEIVFDSSSCDGTALTFHSNSEALSYQWKLDNDTHNSSKVTFENLSPGTSYKVELETSNKNCKNITSQEFTTFSPLNINGQVIDASCNEENGEIILNNIDDKTSIKWNDIETNSNNTNRKNLKIGNYSLVANKNNCSQQLDFSIKEACTPFLHGIVFFDRNNNGVFDNSDIHFQQKKVEISSNAEKLLTNTNVDGSYKQEINNINEVYNIKIDIPNGYSQQLYSNKSTYIINDSSIRVDKNGLLLNILLLDVQSPQWSSTYPDTLYSICNEIINNNRSVVDNSNEEIDVNKDSIISYQDGIIDTITYFWKAEDLSGNTLLDTSLVIFNNTIQSLTIKGNENICVGETIELSTNYNQQVNWYNQQNEKQVGKTSTWKSNTTGTFSFWAERLENCPQKDSIVVTVNEKPTYQPYQSFEINEGNDTIVDIKTTASVNWTTPIGNNNTPTLQLLEIGLQHQGKFIYEIKNEYCSVSDSFNLTVKQNIEEEMIKEETPDEIILDSDGDGVEDIIDLDDDNDGIPDYLEKNTDFDGDNIVNRLDWDSDNDGISDQVEAGYKNQDFVDLNRDGIRDDFGLDIVQNMDFDSDGQPNFLDWDSDNDAIMDKIEGFKENISTQPIKDENKNGWFDYYENIVELSDVDNDKNFDYLDIDSDNDNIPDYEEINIEIFENFEDSNKNGVYDHWEYSNTIDASNGQQLIDFPKAFDDSEQPLFRWKTDVEVYLINKTTWDTCLNFTPNSIAQNIESTVVDIKGECLSITPKEIGVGYYVIRPCESNDCEQINLKINSIQNPKDTIRFDVIEGEEIEICLKNSFSTPEEVRFHQICKPENNSLTEKSISEDYCILYEGTGNGIDQFCYSLCSNNVCDTTIVFIHSPNQLQVKNDEIWLADNHSGLLRILENDNIPNLPFEITIENQPQKGSLLEVENKLFFEFDNINQCPLVDSLEYSVSIPNLETRSATVVLKRLCNLVHVNTGLSPNNDQDNETWIIKGINQYPNNEVFVFDRLGHQVFAQKGYSNTAGWQGTYGNKKLPDDTYFYIIKLNDVENTILNGALTIFRGRK